MSIATGFYVPPARLSLLFLLLCSYPTQKKVRSFVGAMFYYILFLFSRLSLFLSPSFTLCLSLYQEIEQNMREIESDGVLG